MSLRINDVMKLALVGQVHCSTLFRSRVSACMETPHLGKRGLGRNRRKRARKQAWAGHLRPMSLRINDVMKLALVGQVHYPKLFRSRVSACMETPHLGKWGRGRNRRKRARKKAWCGRTDPRAPDDYAFFALCAQRAGMPAVRRNGGKRARKQAWGSGLRFVRGKGNLTALEKCRGSQTSIPRSLAVAFPPVLAACRFFHSRLISHRPLMHKNFTEVIEPNSREADLLAQMDVVRLPQHVAIIMDGNGRWAKQRGKPRIFGHKEGAESVRAILDTFARLEIEAVTLYAFSTENWKRPEDEVSALMDMLQFYIRNEIDEVHENKIRFKAIGDIGGLNEGVREEIQAAEEKTAGNIGTKLNVALNYGGRAEIVEACRKAFSEMSLNGESPEDFSEQHIEQNLYTKGLPEVDLMIRTSGEMRISNFLLWQVAYSEIYVTDTLFPDFRRKEIFKAILDFQKRDRRFGGVKVESASE